MVAATTYRWGGGCFGDGGGVIVSPKSVLEPSTRPALLWKLPDLLGRMIWSHEVAHLQMFVAWLGLAAWRSLKRLMQSFLGFLHWQVRPLGPACPFVAVAYCWLNGQQVGHTLVAVLEPLVVLRVMFGEPCRAREAGVQTLCLELGLHRTEQMLLERWWEGRCVVLLLDGAPDGPSKIMGGFSEF